MKQTSSNLQNPDILFLLKYHEEYKMNNSKTTEGLKYCVGAHTYNSLILVNAHFQLIKIWHEYSHSH